MGRVDSESPTGLTATVVRGAGITAAGYFLTLVITLVSYVVLARLAGPEVFGAFAAAWVLIGVGTLFTESGMGAALIQRDDRLEEAASTAVVSTFAAGIALAGFALALSPIVGLYFDSREVGLVAGALSGILVLNATTVVPDALMRRRFSFLRRLVVDPINALTYGAAAGTTLALGMGVWGLVLATYIAGVVRVAAVWICNWWLPDIRKVSFAMWRELASYARHVVASEFVREVNSVANTALLGRFLGLSPLGEYRFGWTMATQATIPVTFASTYVLLPAFARISGEAERFRRAFLRSWRLLSALVLPISFALPPLGEQIMVTLLGERWRVAGYVLAALAGVTAALPLIALSTEVFKAANRPDLLPRMSLVLTVTTLAFMAAFLPFGSSRGVAAGVSIAYVVTAAYGLRNVARVLALPVRAILAELVRPAFAAASMAGFLVLFVAVVARVDQEPTLVRLGWLGAELLLAILVYGVLLLKFAPLTARELISAIRSIRGSRAEPGGRASAAGVSPDR